MEFNQPTIVEETSKVVIQYNCTTAYVPATDIKINLNLTYDSIILGNSRSECKNGTITIDIKNICNRSSELVHINVTKIIGGECYNDSISPIAVKCPTGKLQ